MAVKVMLAPALAQREAAPPPPSSRGEAKSKPRRSSVFDAEGNEVFITIVCLKCHKTRPLAQFGLRKMADGAIRNQPWCKACRSGTASNGPRQKKVVDATSSAESGAAEISPVRPEQPVDAGLMAAQIVAALHGGRR